MQITIKIIKKLTLFFINLLVLIISFLIPKSNKIAVVGSWFGKRFADNSKYFYLYLNANKKSLGFEKVVWITRSQEIKEELKKHNLQVYSAWSICSIWYHLRAKYHLIDQSPSDINSIFSVRSKRINLWHGFPLKKIGSFMKNNELIRKTTIQKLINKLTVRGCWADQFILATSEFSADILGKAFGVERNRVIISGYPRNYEMIVDRPIKYVPQNEEIIYEIIESYIEKGYTIIGYFPTFRDERETLIFGTEDLDEINNFLDFCEHSKIKFVGKFHFAGKNDKFGKIKDHEAFINLPSEADVYTFLGQLEILITDYSSIYFDFLLWNKPIIFFPYDLEYYRDEDRGLIFDYQEFTPGPKIYDIGELKTLLSENIEVFNVSYEKKFREMADELKTKIFGNYNKWDIYYLINQIKETGFEEEK